MKYKLFLVIMWCSGFLILFPSTAYANSSWHWVTTSPLTVLPCAVIFTLLIETIAVVKFGKVDNRNKAFVIVSLANLLSFLVPYFRTNHLHRQVVIIQTGLF